MGSGEPLGARIARRLNPGMIVGTSAGTWWRLLRENHFAVEARYWPRAAIVSAASGLNSLLGLAERIALGHAVRRVVVSPPLFILGYWRSGTTHLHNLFARDDRFGFPTFYDVLFPHHFLLSAPIGRRIVARLMPSTRVQDNVRLGVDEPQEEELALASLIGRSAFLAALFPRRSREYYRCALRSLPWQDQVEWQQTLLQFLRRLTFRERRPLVLKSPGHTGKIRLLLGLFPEARFVHIRRHPFDVFRSNVTTATMVGNSEEFQRHDPAQIEENVRQSYREVYDAYFEERSLIPAGRLHEIAFEDLERDPLAKIRETYRALDLPEFQHVETSLAQYVASLRGYTRNTFKPLPDALRDSLFESWSRVFHEWGYSPDGPG